MQIKTFSKAYNMELFGLLSAESFGESVILIMVENLEAKIRFINDFKCLDPDGDGRISEQEMIIVFNYHFECLSVEEICEIMYSKDLFTIGIVDLEILCRILGVRDPSDTSQ
ncbi:hypothetical protein RF11_13067 [Thelohanellus kitauei]|uniref:EF-hand domain-containing protein n=1 Tax=Thelohanellus kitauei TaxID=669202 RepID=A0A0C2MRH9_THEKT|nr:hypothetical protein RF11_13067 [Thelohanellus kitauei]